MQLRELQLVCGCFRHPVQNTTQEHLSLGCFACSTCKNMMSCGSDNCHTLRFCDLCIEMCCVAQRLNAGVFHYVNDAAQMQQSIRYCEECTNVWLCEILCILPDFLSIAKIAKCCKSCKMAFCDECNEVSLCPF